MPELSSELSKELDKLRKALQSGRNDVVAFVGAGLSSPPLQGWSELLGGLAVHSEPARASLAEGKLREAAATLEASVPRDDVVRALVTQARVPDATRPAGYKLLAALPLQHFLTGNRDGWLVAALAEKLGAPPATLVPTDATALSELTSATGPTVVLLHGDATRPETLVLGEAGYKTLGQAPRHYAAAAKGLVAGRKVLFVGVTPRDPDVAALLDGWAELFSADEAAGLGAPRHFFVGSGISKDEEAFLFKLRIRPIEVGPALLETALAYLAGVAPPPAPRGVETASRGIPRPASAAAPTSSQAAARAEPAPAAAPAALKEKYDPLARVKAAELEATAKTRELDVKRLEEELAAQKSVAARVPALEKELAAQTALSARVPALEDELAKLRIHDAEAKKLEEEIAQAFEKRDQDATRLEAELAPLMARVPALEAELAKLRASGPAPAAAKAFANDPELAQLRSRAASLEAELASLKARMPALEAELAQARARPAAAITDDAPLRSRIAELEALVAASPGTASLPEDVAKRVQSLEARIGELAGTRSDLEAARRKLEAEKNELAQRVAHLEGERVRHEAERQKQEAQRIKLDTRIRELEERGTKTGGADRKLATVEGERAALEKRAAELQELASTLESELANAKSAIESEHVSSAAAATRKSEAESQLDRLRAELEAERGRAPAGASKAPLIVGILLLLVGLGAAGVAIFQPALLDPLRSALGAASSGPQGGNGGGG